MRSPLTMSPSLSVFRRRAVRLVFSMCACVRFPVLSCGSQQEVRTLTNAEPLLPYSDQRRTFAATPSLSVRYYMSYPPPPNPIYKDSY